MGVTPTRFLLIGYGNPGRLDDGLGPRLAEQLEELDLVGVDIDADYQLTVEDAAVVAEHDVVVFADAALSGPEPFYVERVAPSSDMGFTTHGVEPPTVLGLAHEMFEGSTRGYVLGIRGYEFNEFGERLSERALANLEAAREFISDVLARRDEKALEARCEPLAAGDEPAS